MAFEKFVNSSDRYVEIPYAIELAHEYFPSDLIDRLYAKNMHDYFVTIVYQHVKNLYVSSSAIVDDNVFCEVFEKFYASEASFYKHIIDVGGLNGR